MVLFDVFRLINILFAIGYGTSAIYTILYDTHVLSWDIATQRYSRSILSIDKIPISILSLLSSNISDGGGGKNEFLMQCRYEYSNDRHTLSKIDQFEVDYTSEQAISWYTRDSFVYRFINESLRSGNIQQINKCRYFIRDLHGQLTDLHRTKYRRNIVEPTQIFYRGMTLSSEDRNELLVGKLITFNSFISASLSREVAMMFAGNAVV